MRNPSLRFLILFERSQGANLLAQLYSFLAHLNLLPRLNQPLTYSTQSLRYSLRMRPFLPLSLPDVPSYPDFTSLVSLRTLDSTNSSNASADDTKQQALSILDVADQAMKAARKEWEAISKVSAETARCAGCEDWWRSSVKDVVRACIAGNIALATARRGLTGLRDGRDVRDAFKVELPEKTKRYHPWWVVPTISIL